MQSFQRACSASVVLLACLAIPSLARAIPDVAVLEVQAPEILYLGQPNEVRARIKNLGTTAAMGFYYRVVISRTNTINLYDDPLVQTGPISLAAGAETQLVVQIEIPDFVAIGEYYIGFILDPNRALDEPNRLNNAMPAGNMSMVRFPAPDLVVSEVRVGTSGAAGETLRVNFTVENRGNLATGFDYAVYLSHNEIISHEDVLLFLGADHLEPGESKQRTDYVMLPAGLPAGSYHVGVLADPDNLLEELSKEGNVGRAALPLQVEEAALRLMTSWIPEAVVGQPIAWRFVAVGATGNYVFSIEGGELPLGVELDEELGEISGVPEEAGEWAFVLGVRSGGLFVASGYVLRVVRPSISLTVNTDALPPAIHQTSYRMRLGAIGGQPPYTWSVGSGLPSGIELDSDGLLHGTPSATGSFELDLRVRDNAGYGARRTLQLRVVDRGSLTILTGLLPQGRVGEGYPTVGMDAMGATGYLTWSIVEGRMPPGITLEPESGIIRGIAAEAGRFNFRVRARDEAGLADINGYSIEILSQPLYIVTHDAQPAKVGESYEQAFHMPRGAGLPPYNWRLLSGVLPSGLELLQPDGESALISGTPEEGSEGMYTFGLEVEDAAGARGMKAYVLEVRSSATDGALAVQPEPPGGCETGAGRGWIFGLGLLGLAGLLLAGKRRAAGTGLALALLLAPSAAWSQAWSYSRMSLAHPYEPITGGTVLTALSDKGDAHTSVTLPFPFEFYGQTYNQVHVSSNGFISFESISQSHFSNAAIPNTAAPNGILALWWTDLSTQSSKAPNAEISTKVLGSPPNRVFVIQYKDLTVYSGTYHPMNFQARIYEGTTTLEAHYGPIAGTSAGSASAGIENQSGTVGLPGLTCTPTCGGGAFPTNHKVVYGTLPNLVATEVIAPATVWSGVPAQVSGTVANLGGEGAGPFDVVAVIAGSPGSILGGQIIGRGRISQGLEVGQSRPISLIAEVPEHVASNQDYWVSLIPNPDGEVEEAGSGTNYAPPVKVRVGPPMPNLRVISVTPLADEVLLGEEILVAYELANSGNLGADTTYWIVLSSNEVITTQDLILFQDNLSIGARSTLSLQTSVPIPDDIMTGSYYVGVILDPEGMVFEPDVTGNARAAATPTAVTGDGIVVLTSTLPAGRVGRSYSAFLRAAGGPEAYRWRVASGVLPAGLTLSEDGWIEGRPTVAGDHSFQVLVRSGTLLAVESYSISVDADSTPLTVVSATLPGGAVGFDYSARLYATGGEPPYVWGLGHDAVAPPGISLTGDGRLLGIPREPGTYDLVVEVTDTQDTVVEVALEIEINMTGHLLVTTTALPEGRLGEEYVAKLQAAGGREPYRWALDGTTQLPAGLTLGSNGFIEGVPAQVGVFDVVVTVRDDRGHNNGNTFSLVIGYAQGLAITTQRLPHATGGWDYEAGLSAWGGTAPYTWNILSGSLPLGLSLDEAEGRIHGVPSDDGVTRHVPFIIEARDSVGRTAMRALSISVGPAPSVMESEGCSVSGGGGSGAFVLLVAAFVTMGLLPRRRRRGWEALAPKAAVVLSAMVLFSSGCGGGNLCEDVACPAGTTCSQGDGLCRCGGPSGELCQDGDLCDPASGLCLSAANPCEGIVCSGGLACDPDDGTCKCGGAGGRLCDAHESCDPVTSRCVAPDPCLELSCAGEEVCDPATGQCVCGEAEGCPVGERCSSGECVVDLCYGVTCAGGNVCDPVDGTCRCGGSGGPLCESEEVCDPGAKECLEAASCVSVTCPPGMSCDPNDGSCKCGGISGTSCAADQFCDPITALCLSGDPCAEVVCTAGTTCDPEDGVCRCGGYGGQFCVAGEWCVEPSGMDRLCSPSCSPVFQDCEGELSCYYDEGTDRTFCTDTGSAGDGAFCTVSPDCAPGMHCRLEGSARKCRHLCDTAAAYPQPGSCHLQSYCAMSFDMRSEIGICIDTG